MKAGFLYILFYAGSSMPSKLSGLNESSVILNDGILNAEYLSEPLKILDTLDYLILTIFFWRR